MYICVRKYIPLFWQLWTKYILISNATDSGGKENNPVTSRKKGRHTIQPKPALKNTANYTSILLLFSAMNFNTLSDKKNT